MNASTYSETIFDPTELTEKIRQIEAEIELDSFWDENPNAQEIFQSLNQYKRKRQSISAIHDNLANAQTGLELLTETPNDTELHVEVEKLIQTLTSTINTLEIECLLSHEWDNLNCIFTINAGAGGTDAQDWAEMLLRMYMRWFQSKNFKAECTEITSGDEAGIKSATLMVSGPFCYGLSKNEIGIHRLVRQSPFNANAKRQTSFAAVDVIPEFSDSYKHIKLDTKDLRIDTYRASGAGGQHINKTDSAVRITHLPTGIVAQSQAQRSQTANKETAMKILTSRIVTQLELQQKEKINDLKSTNDIAWGNQIRSYVFHPYKMVKDHRTNEETSNIQKVMDGEIDNFIESHLRFKSIRS
ncbi:MAG: peptide chain release factor 2 [Candidatus Margulisiibacteriota bacterium]